MATEGLKDLAPCSDKVVPALAAEVRKDRGWNSREIAATQLAGLGVAARSALPALREGVRQGLVIPNSNMRVTCERAIEQIEKAKDEPGSVHERKKRLAILKDIDEVTKARAK